MISYTVASPLPEDERQTFVGQYGGGEFYADRFEVGRNMPGIVRAIGAVKTKTGKRHKGQSAYRPVNVGVLHPDEREALMQGAVRYAGELHIRLKRDLAEVDEHLDAIRRTIP